MFGYLSEFWDQIASSTSESVEWFQSVGNAVAGAIGNVLLMPLRVIVEAFLAIGWIVSNLGQIVVLLLSPFKFLGVFFSTFFNYFENAPSASSLVSFDAGVLAFLASFPYFATLLSVISALIFVLAIVAIIRRLNI